MTQERQVKKIKLNNPWLEMWFRHSCSYHLATDAMTNNVDAYLTQYPRALVDYCLPPSDEPLDPLEFHGRSREPAV